MLGAIADLSPTDVAFARAHSLTGLRLLLSLIPGIPGVGVETRETPATGGVLVAITGVGYVVLGLAPFPERMSGRDALRGPPASVITSPGLRGPCTQIRQGAAAHPFRSSARPASTTTEGPL